MASSDFKIEREETARKEGVPVTVFRLRGWLDAQSETSLLAAAQQAYDSGVRHLIINFEDVSILTSAGIRAVQKIYRLFLNAEAQTGGLRICSAPPQVYHPLAVTGFLQTLPMYETQPAALASYDS